MFTVVFAILGVAVNACKEKQKQEEKKSDLPPVDPAEVAELKKQVAKEREALLSAWRDLVRRCSKKQKKSSQ